jgi:putative peptide zinc metalloprotease protein
MDTAQWPELRSELALFNGPKDHKGHPTWSLNDPVRNLFFSIDWLTFEILSRWHFGDADMIAESVNSETSLEIDRELVGQVAAFINQNELMQRDSEGAVQWLAQERKRRRQSAWRWLLQNYLFFRLPMVSPDKWLGRNVDAVSFLFTPIFWWLTALVGMLGLSQVIQQWDVFITQLVDFFSVAGLLLYGVTIVAVKTLHELGHAFTAKRFGCRVPTMGIAFLVLFPMAYTDVNDVWKLTNRRQRLWVGAAGIVTELGLAVWATLLWTLLPEGGLKDASFLVASTTWISTLLINASPFMRFDGYFLLMDALGLPNLHHRAFEQAKWRLRESLFNLGDEKPEYFSPRMTRFLNLFAVGIWLYRTIVFVGIAALLYYALPKPFGPLLAGIELGVFIIMPVVRELHVWSARRAEILSGRRSKFLLSVIILLGLLAVVPWDGRIHSQALYRPVKLALISSPGAAQISQILVVNGQYVEAGQPLVTLKADDLGFQLEAEKAKQLSAQWQLSASGIDDKRREKLGVILADQQRANTRVSNLREEMLNYQINAPQAGVVILPDPDIAVGDWVGQNTHIADLFDRSGREIVTYIDERSLSRVREGQRAIFIAEHSLLENMALIVKRVDSDATRQLQEGVLASTHGGEVLVREVNGMRIPEQAIYRVLLEPAETGKEMPVNMSRGQVVIYADTESWLGKYVLNAAAVLRREIGF